ncbi:uncharacterized protein LOC135289006 isoform X1 [Passer domesticus]|uniref:uncharacterized protein LOC135289006 isoform X1 n=1 Tax=Passer domesticus TaxID=48849 RepID=UPI0030FE5275
MGEVWATGVGIEETGTGEGVEPRDTEPRDRPLLARDVTEDRTRPRPRSVRIFRACAFSGMLPVSPGLMSLSPSLSPSDVSSPVSVPDSLSSFSDAVSTPCPRVCDPCFARARTCSAMRADRRGSVSGSCVTAVRPLRLLTGAARNSAAAPSLFPASDVDAAIWEPFPDVPRVSPPACVFGTAPAKAATPGSSLEAPGSRPAGHRRWIQRRLSDSDPGISGTRFLREKWSVVLSLWLLLLQTLLAAFPRSYQWSPGNESNSGNCPPGSCLLGCCPPGCSLCSSLFGSPLGLPLFVPTFGPTFAPNFAHTQGRQMPGSAVTCLCPSTGKSGSG